MFKSICKRFKHTYESLVREHCNNIQHKWNGIKLFWNMSYNICQLWDWIEQSNIVKIWPIGHLDKCYRCKTGSGILCLSTFLFTSTNYTWDFYWTKCRNFSLVILNWWEFSLIFQFSYFKNLIVHATLRENYLTWNELYRLACWVSSKKSLTKKVQKNQPISLQNAGDHKLLRDTKHIVKSGSSFVVKGKKIPFACL